MYQLCLQWVAHLEFAPFCRANESLLNPWSKLFWYNGSVLASGYRGTGSIPAILINFFVFFYCRRGVGGGWKVSKGGGRGEFGFF